jgi:hypothetical protein
MNSFYQRRQYTDNMQRYHMQENGGGVRSNGGGVGSGGGGGGSGNIMDMAGTPTSIPGAQTLDDIVNQNAKELRRHSMQSMSVPFQNPANVDMDDGMRRASMVDMMDFGGASPDMASFTFDPRFGSTMVDMPPHANDNSRGRGGPNVNNLLVNTRFPAQAFGPMDQQTSAFDSAISGQDTRDLDLHSPYLTSAFPSGVTMGNDMNMMSTDIPSANIFGTDQFNSPMVTSPIHTTYGASMLGPTLQDPSGGNGGQVPEADVRGSNAAVSASATPDIGRLPSTGTNSNENASQGTSQHGNSSTQPTNVARSSLLGEDGLTFSPKKMAANPLAGHEIIGGNALPWSAPPGRIKYNLGTDVYCGVLRLILQKSGLHP